MRLSGRLHMFLTLIAATILCFSGCSGNGKKPDEENGPMLAEKASINDSFLSYTDSLTKLPLSKLNDLGIVAINKAFANKLPIGLYSSKAIGHDSIIVYPYKNNDIATVRAGIRLLVPQSITDSLTIGDFTRYFGDIRKEKPMIGVTEQPLPVQININANTALKLTFNNNQKLDLAHVTMVEVLKYR